MRRAGSTLVVVAGDGAADVVSGLAGLLNVRAAVVGDTSAEQVTQAALRSSATYAVLDADPLGKVGAEWTDFFDGQGVPGALEMAIEEAIAGLRAESAVLPDYYIVLDPEGMTPTRRHWWLGVLAGAAPSRVIPAPAAAAQVAARLGALPAGRWWPADHAAWLRELPRIVPDRAGSVPAG